MTYIEVKSVRKGRYESIQLQDSSTLHDMLHFHLPRNMKTTTIVTKQGVITKNATKEDKTDNIYLIQNIAEEQQKNQQWRTQNRNK